MNLGFTFATKRTFLLTLKYTKYSYSFQKCLLSRKSKSNLHKAHFAKTSIYKFYSTCESLPDLRENNGRFNIYVNTKGKTDGLSFDLEEFFKYINGGTSSIGKESNCELVQVLDGYVQEYNENDTWRGGFMKLDMLIHDNRKEGYEQGLSQGLSQGKAEGLSQGHIEEKRQVIKNLKTQGLSDEIIAKAVSINANEIQHFLDSRKQ